MKKMVVIVSLLLFSLITYCASSEGAKSFETMDEVSEWPHHYYKSLDIESVAPAIRALFKYKIFDKDSTIPFTIAFLSTIFDENQDMLEGWMAELKNLDSRERQFLWIAIDLSNKPKGQELLKKIREKETEEDNKKFIDTLLTSLGKDILLIKIDSAAVLDMLWGKFFASGDKQCVRRIISVLSWVKDNEKTEKFFIGEAAQWSLTSNASRHRLVLEVCLEELKTQPDEVKEILREIVDEKN